MGQATILEAARGTLVISNMLSLVIGGNDLHAWYFFFSTHSQSRMLDAWYHIFKMDSPSLHFANSRALSFGCSMYLVQCLGVVVMASCTPTTCSRCCIWRWAYRIYLGCHDCRRFCISQLMNFYYFCWAYSGRPSSLCCRTRIHPLCQMFQSSSR